MGVRGRTDGDEGVDQQGAAELALAGFCPVSLANSAAATGRTTPGAVWVGELAEPSVGFIR
jgi:hypothetical protein